MFAPDFEREYLILQFTHSISMDLIVFYNFEMGTILEAIVLKYGAIQGLFKQ